MRSKRSRRSSFVGFAVRTVISDALDRNCENFPYRVAELLFYLKDEATNPLFRVARAAGQNLLRERIHAAARFS